MGKVGAPVDGTEQREPCRGSEPDRIRGWFMFLRCHDVHAVHDSVPAREQLAVSNL